MSVTLPSLLVVGPICLAIAVLAYWLVDDLMQWVTRRWVKPHLAARMGCTVEEMDRRISDLRSTAGRH